ncbi:MAG: RNA polymerase subunit sigma, partial [Verrucomicrobiales bacterium]|nr:RNA polymerase subunit sigma [Verrucomicrobiales bacterium]
FFAGMNHLEVAEVLGVNEKTVRRRWELARVRLHALIMSAPE